MYVGSSIYNGYNNYSSNSMNMQSRYQQQEQAFMDALSPSSAEEGMQQSQGMGRMQGMGQGMQGMPPPPPPGGMGEVGGTQESSNGIGTLMDYVSSLPSDEQSSTIQELSSLTKEGMDALVDALGTIDNTDMTDEELTTEIASVFEEIMSQYASSNEESTTESVVIDTYA